MRNSCTWRIAHWRACSLRWAPGSSRISASTASVSRTNSGTNPERRERSSAERTGPGLPCRACQGSSRSSASSWRRPSSSSMRSSATRAWNRSPSRTPQGRSRTRTPPVPSDQAWRVRRLRISSTSSRKFSKESPTTVASGDSRTDPMRTRPSKARWASKRSSAGTSLPWRAGTPDGQETAAPFWLTSRTAQSRLAPSTVTVTVPRRGARSAAACRWGRKKTARPSPPSSSS